MHKTPATLMLDRLRFEQDRRQLVIGILLLTIPVVLFAASDVLTARGQPAVLATLLGVRFGSLLAVAFGVRRLLRVTDRDRFARIVTLSCYVIVLLVLAVHALRPPDLISPFFFDLLLLFVLYATVPSSWRQQAGPALVLTLGSILFLVFYHTDVNVVEGISILTILLVVNAAGMSLGWARTVAERREEEFVEREWMAREALERTTGELRVLRGILPICAHCRKVRDERGAWAELEAYVRRNMDADFSHGICPECVEEHFPEQARP